MKIYSTIAATGMLAIMLASPAGAQLADKRSFMHPLGFWSNECFVAQKRVYPRIIAARHYPADPASGGWVLHERNW